MSKSQWKPVFFDLETTGLDPSNHHREVRIVSIAAVFGDRHFHAHVLPDRAISSEAAAVHGMTKKDGQLMLKGEPIPNVLALREALSRLRVFLQEVQRGEETRIVLVAHNCFGFDSWVLCRSLDRCQISLDGIVGMFRDTMDVARSVARSRGGEGDQSGLGLGKLMLKYLGKERAAVHSAKEDAENLRDVIRAMASKDGVASWEELLEKESPGLEFKERMAECVREQREWESVPMGDYTMEWLGEYEILDFDDFPRRFVAPGVEQTEKFRQVFASFARKYGGRTIPTNKLGRVMSLLGEHPSKAERHTMIMDVFADEDETIDLAQFMSIMVYRINRIERF